MSGSSSRKSLFSFSKQKKNGGPLLSPSTGGPKRALSVRSLKYNVHDINGAYRVPKTENYTEKIHTFFSKDKKTELLYSTRPSEERSSSSEQISEAAKLENPKSK